MVSLTVLGMRGAFIFTLSSLYNTSLLILPTCKSKTMAAPTGSAAVDAELTAKLEEQSIQQEYKKVRVSTFL